MGEKTTIDGPHRARKCDVCGHKRQCMRIVTQQTWREHTFQVCLLCLAKMLWTALGGRDRPQGGKETIGRRHGAK